MLSILESRPETSAPVPTPGSRRLLPRCGDLPSRRWSVYEFWGTRDRERALVCLDALLRVELSPVERERIARERCVALAETLMCPSRRDQVDRVALVLNRFPTGRSDRDGVCATVLRLGDLPRFGADFGMDVAVLWTRPPHGSSRVDLLDGAPPPPRVRLRWAHGSGEIVSTSGETR